jgi:antitoxin component of RelBE/YafQ-DinJ toxin-antitoxin module
MEDERDRIALLQEIISLRSAPMEVLLVNILPAEWTSNEENHETTAAIGECRNAGKKLVRHQHFYR